MEDYFIHSYEDFVNEIDSPALFFFFLLMCLCRERWVGLLFCPPPFFSSSSSSSTHPLDSVHKAEIAQVADGCDLNESGRDPWRRSRLEGVFLISSRIC